MELGTPSLDLIGLKRSLVRILFVHRFLAEVEHCLSELKKARFVLSADVVVTSEQFAERPFLEEVTGVGVDLSQNQAYPRMPLAPDIWASATSAGKSAMLGCPRIGASMSS